MYAFLTQCGDVVAGRSCSPCPLAVLTSAHWLPSVCVLLSRHGVGMPDHKAVAFVGRVCDTYKPGAEVKQSLIKLSQKVPLVSHLVGCCEF